MGRPIDAACDIRVAAHRGGRGGRTIGGGCPPGGVAGLGGLLLPILLTEVLLSSRSARAPRSTLAARSRSRIGPRVRRPRARPRAGGDQQARRGEHVL